MQIYLLLQPVGTENSFLLRKNSNKKTESPIWVDKPDSFCMDKMAGNSSVDLETYFVSAVHKKDRVCVIGL